MSDRFYICHQAIHVANVKECTVTPYGDISLYDPGCHPVELKLVGLVPWLSTDAEDLGEPPDERICLNRDHHSRGLSCARESRPSTASSMHDGHDWATFYKKGMYVVVRAKVAIDSRWVESGNHVLVGFDSGKRLNVIGVPRSEVYGYIDGPIPPEPDRKAMLRSKENGRLFYYNDAWREAPGENNNPNTWEELYNVYGPFDIFTPKGDI